jgi:glycosyltransferase involved in cell wall biosynthesis
MKVIILNPSIPDYRLPIFNLLGKSLKLTVGHSGKLRTENNLSFKQIYLKINKWGPFSFSSKNIHSLCKKFDVVISEGNIRYIDRNILILNPFRKYKWISWGIGVSASYNKKFDKDKRLDWIRFFIFRRADAQVFYSNYPLEKYKAANFDSESLFIANNTTEVKYNEKKQFFRNSLLFVGTLYEQKKIFDLLEAYAIYIKQKSGKKLFLNIVGDGIQFSIIKKWIEQQKLSKYIFLQGAVFDQGLLEKFFRSALACISPGQAGLSVLTSMGYGTPFITQKDAITGGEIFNVKNEENGILYSKKSELISILNDISKNTDKYILMGRKARAFYLKKRTPKQMVNVLKNACQYTLTKKG